jgi:nitrous oxidase accessory protein
VRDGIYVSATEDSLIEDNIARGVRFGIHYMYSYRNSIRGNLTEGNTVGIALMESRDLEVIGNRSVGNIRNGLLFRDVQGSEIRGNWLERNGNGMFFFSSTENTIVGNHVIDNDIGLKVWAGTRRNRIEENILRGNREQVMYVGAEDQVWGGSGRGNVWGDYVGWDQDRDGVGDRPHRVDSFTASLLYRHPSAVLLLRSPAVEALAHLADRIPLLRVPTVIDLSPLVVEPEHEHGAAGVEGE